jgi:cell division septation protein DedD
MGDVLLMRRLLIAIFCMIIVSHLSAQTKLGDYSTQGAASQQMTREGLVGAHSSLPLNSKVKITNPQNGREVEITIVERIDPSRNRIIDLSPAAASALQLKAGEQVVITVGAPPRPVTQRSSMQEPIIDLLEPIIVAQDGRQSSIKDQPASLSGQEPSVKEPSGQEKTSSDSKLNDGYRPEFTLDDPAVLGALFSGANSGDAEFLAWLMVMAIEAREARDARSAREARETREIREAREEREIREIREAREAREAREMREIREARERREAALSAARAAAAANTAQNVTEKNQTPANQTPANQTPANNQPVINNRPVINLPPTGKQNNDSRPLNLNTFEPMSAVPQKDESPSSSLRVSANQSNSDKIQPSVQRQEQARLEPVKPESLQIIPGLPDRYSGKSYKLQIGAYSSQETANRTAALLRNAGFHAEVEFSGAIYRVFAAGIPSVDVYSASVRLGSLGFNQIWVKE